MAFDKEAFKAIWAEEIESIAREHAKETASNVLNEKHGLARAIAVVLSDKNLLDKSLEQAKAKYQILTDPENQPHQFQ